MLDYPIAEQIQDLMPSLALAGIMGSGVYSLKYVSITNQLALLSAQIITGIVIYTGICYIFRISSFMEIIEMIKSKLLNLRYAD
ncbi:MAG: lipopolysaccharide biosynthesis protein, partial [Desulfobacteraceae bacterium]|nr:lipopolysaccharide biosynthesis protein [Desulfobacteraceae bacterium]MBC2718366.1 lipopolysaccharide biosynthesis protein [Desulfobacteraceae bacterium]